MALMLLGCGAPYRATAPGPGEVALASECLDVHVFEGSPEPDLPRPMPVLGYRIGNRCMHPVDLDVRQIEVTADVGGRLAPLRPHDPRRELGPASLDGHTRLVEQIAYELPITADHVARVCVRLDGAPACFDLSQAVRGEESPWAG